jgi:LysM repeat protein
MDSLVKKPTLQSLAISYSEQKETIPEVIPEVKPENKQVVKVEPKKPEVKKQDPKKDTNKKPTTKVHVVKKGDSLYGIAAKYKTTVPLLKKANKLKSDNLQIGQKLTIP